MGLFDNLGDAVKQAQAKLKEAGEKAQEKLREAGERAQERRREAEDQAKAASGGGEMAPDDLKETVSPDAWDEARSQMREELSPEVCGHLRDLLLEGEEVVYSVRSSADGERSQLALTTRNLFLFSKGLLGGQGQDGGGGLLGAVLARGRLSMRIYPLPAIQAFEIQPQKGMAVGHFQVLTAATSENDNESKFLLDSKLGYFKAVLLYRKILELQHP